MTKPISISSCHNCKPHLWKPGKKSVATYKCKNCRLIVNVVLTKKRRK